MGYQIIKGTIPIMLSAPHAMKHYRDGAWKQADQNTDELAIAIQKATGCHVIYRNQESLNDPNFDDFENCQYKQALKKYIEEKQIKILMDLHGSKKERGFLIDLGTIDDSYSSLHERKWVIEMMVPLLKKGLKVVMDRYQKTIEVNHTFKASGKNTITNCIASKTLCSCVQMEMNSYLRCCNKDDFQLLQATLIQVVTTLKTELIKRESK